MQKNKELTDKAPIPRTLLGREMPDLPAEVMFSDLELRTLNAYAKKGINRPLLLAEAVRLIARIGGYLGRKNDPPPGHQVMWYGYAEFQFMCLGFDLRDERASPALFTGRGQG